MPRRSGHCGASTALKDTYDQKHLCIDSHTLNTNALRCTWLGTPPRAGSWPCLLRLTRRNAVFQSPLRPGSPLLKVLAECSTCGPGNALVNAEIQVSALRQIRDKFGCISKFRETKRKNTRSKWPECGRMREMPDAFTSCLPRPLHMLHLCENFLRCVTPVGTIRVSQLGLKTGVVQLRDLDILGLGDLGHAPSTACPPPTPSVEKDQIRFDL